MLVLGEAVMRLEGSVFLGMLPGDVRLLDDMFLAIAAPLPPKLVSIVCIIGCTLEAKPIPACDFDLVVIPIQTLRFPAFKNISSLCYCANCFLLNFFCKSTNSS